MQYAPTRVRTKFGGFHISPHGYAKNAPDFTFPNKDTPKTRSILGPNRRRGTFRGVCFCAPTRVRAKSARFHISAHGYAKNTPDFTLSNKDTPKTRPILGLNRRRGTFRGVCFCALHGYTKNAPDFTFSNKDTPITRSILDPNLRRETFRGVCNTPLHGYVQNLTGFRPKPSAQDFFGAYAIRPYTGTCKIWRVSYFRT